jgi:hypothetical protein
MKFGGIGISPVQHKAKQSRLTSFHTTTDRPWQKAGFSKQMYHANSNSRQVRQGKQKVIDFRYFIDIS